MLPGPRGGSEKYIVGRDREVREFNDLLDGRTDHSLLNIYGPGGIGKTEVFRKLAGHANARHTPVAAVDVGEPDLSPVRILEAAAHTLCASESADRHANAFGGFFAQLSDYRAVEEILRHTGGIDELFDVLGNPRDPTGLATVLDALAGATSDSLRQLMRNRFALDRYWRDAERTLTRGFADALGSVLADGDEPVALLVDTYEEAGGVDNWMCRTLVPALPTGTRVVILGRNQLTRTNFDWADHGEALRMRPLPELREAEAKAYLRHYGLTDAAALGRVHRFTGGYPLLLMLVRLLAQEAGGWAAIGEMEHSSDRDSVATRLLERLLREERVHEVRDVLEKCAVAPWVNPEIISQLLEVSSAEARTIYVQVQRHSFMEQHPYGVKLHDKIRELLEERLKFTSEAEYDKLRDTLAAYFARKAGITSAPEVAERGGASLPDVVVLTDNCAAQSEHLAEVKGATGSPEAIGGRPRVFVSYAHDTEAHKSFVLEFCELLVSCGLDVHVDRWDTDERRDWQVWATNQIRGADYVIVVASPHCKQAGDGDLASQTHRGIQSEMRTLRELYHSDPITWRRRVLPVVLPDGSVDDIPVFLQPRTADHYLVGQMSMQGVEDLLRVMTRAPAHRRPVPGRLPALPPRPGAADDPGRQVE